jgi:hypothetical protein
MTPRLLSEPLNPLIAVGSVERPDGVSLPEARMNKTD